MQPSGSRGQPLTQLPGHHLAGGVARQLVEEHHVAGERELRQLVADPVAHLLGVELLTRAEHHEGGEPLAEVLVVDADDRDLHLDCYWARLEDPGPLASTDHDLLEWLTREELATKDWADADVPVLAQILEGAQPRFGRS